MFNVSDILSYISSVADQLPFVKSFVPALIRFIPALLIFIGILLLGRLCKIYMFRILLKLCEKTKISLDNHVVMAFERPVRLFFTFLGIYLALLYLPLNPEYDLLLTKFFRSSLIILVTAALYNLVGSYNVLHEDVEQVFGIHIDKILLPFFSKLLRVLVIIVSLTILAQEWDYDINSPIAGLGLGGLAFALAAKDTVSNIFGGIVIITDKPFSIGDWINTPSVEGVVEDINFRSTKVRTFAQAVVTVPNATLANESVTNWTRMGKRRISFNLGVTYTTPKIKLEKCVKEIKSMLENHPEIHREFISVTFDSFNASSLDILIYFFTNTTDWPVYLKVKEDINFKIMGILEQEGVSVAFPSRSIYFETALATKNEVS